MTNRSAEYSSLTNPTLFRIETAGGNLVIFAAITLFARLTLRNLGEYGSLMMLDNNARRVLTVSSAVTKSPPLLLSLLFNLTRASSFIDNRSCRASRSEKEKHAVPAALASLLDNSAYFSFSAAVTGGSNSDIPSGSNNPIMKLFMKAAEGTCAEYDTAAAEKYKAEVEARITSLEAENGHLAARNGRL